MGAVNRMGGRLVKMPEKGLDNSNTEPREEEKVKMGQKTLECL